MAENYNLDSEKKSWFQRFLDLFRKTSKEVKEKVQDTVEDVKNSEFHTLTTLQPPLQPQVRDRLLGHFLPLESTNPEVSPLLPTNQELQDSSGLFH